jgi:hypothetical protein
MEGSPDLIIVTARIYFRTTADGGRQGPVKTAYRANHVFEAQDDVRRLQTYIGEIRFSDIPLIYPGVTHRDRSIFATAHPGKIHPGRKEMVDL